VRRASRYYEQAAAALRAVRIRGATRYSWLGRSSRPLPPALEADLDAAERRDHLVSALRDELYASFYCHGSPVPARSGVYEPMAADRRLLQALTEANAGCGSWEPGWVVERLEGERAVLRAEHLRARVRREDCRTVAGPLVPGARADVRLPKDLPDRSPGFLTILGDAVFDASGGAVRVYWSTRPAGAPALVRALSANLNATGVPFRLKVADHDLRFDRCDAAVLYLPAQAFADVRGLLVTVAVAVARTLRPVTPAFAAELAPGVGLAEDRLDGPSFGTQRCALLADAIVRAHEQRVSSVRGRLDVVAGRFAEGGVSLDAPYLDPSLAGRHVL
jgi:hypothetical protein